MARSCRCTAPRQTNARLAHLINARPRLRSGRTKLAIVRSALRALERNVASSWRADHCAGGTAQVAHGLAHRSSHSHCATTSSNATTCCAACGRAKRAIPPVVRRWTSKRNGYGMWVITSTEERWRDLVSAEWGNTRSDKEAVSTSVEEFRDTPCAIDVWLC